MVSGEKMEIVEKQVLRCFHVGFNLTPHPVSSTGQALNPLPQGERKLFFDGHSLSLEAAFSITLKGSGISDRGSLRECRLDLFHKKAASLKLLAPFFKGEITDELVFFPL